MENNKPSLEEYAKWLEEDMSVSFPINYENYYDNVTLQMKSQFEKSLIWRNLSKNLREYNDEYFQQKNFQLFITLDTPDLYIKPYESFLLKTYRKNILDNTAFPEPPSEGWYLPENWYSKVNDTLRTLIQVKYLDGVEFLIKKMDVYCQEIPSKFEYYFQSKEEGYYAGHAYITNSFEIPNQNWDTKIIDAKIEIQITTQLQEVIRKLLHNYYEETRKTDKKNDQWQWKFRSNEFAANYLGHILHYLEGIIVEVRDEQQKHKESLP